MVFFSAYGLKSRRPAMTHSKLKSTIIFTFGDKQLTLASFNEVVILGMGNKVLFPILIYL